MNHQFHINSNGIPSMCLNEVKDCPFGDESTHFKTINEAHEYIESINEFAIGNCSGRYHKVNSEFNSIMSEFVTKYNVEKLFERSLNESPMIVEMDKYDMGGRETKFTATVNRELDRYIINGEINEYSLYENDFDSKRDFEKYLNGSPDRTINIDFSFKSEDILEVLVGHNQLEEGRHKSEAVSVVVYGLYLMSIEKAVLRCS